MSRFKILGVVIVAVFAVSLAVAAMASAVEFLLALWLLNNVAVTTPVLADIEGELTLISLNGGGLKVEVQVLCSGILDGFVEAESLDLITELLSLAEVAIEQAELSGAGLTCTNLKNCAEPLVWADVPFESEVELMIDGTETFFVDLLINAGYYVECMSLKFSELCVGTGVFILKNETNGTVSAETSETIQLLGGGVLANCSIGGAATGVVTSEGNGVSIILDAAGPPLAASSE